MKRILLSLAGLVAVLVGLGFVMPAVALWRQFGTMPGSSVSLLLLGLLLTLGGFALAVTAFRRSQS